MKKNEFAGLLAKNTLALLAGLVLFSCEQIENTTYEEVIGQEIIDQESQQEEDTNRVTGSLAQLISETEELSLLKSALSKAELETLLEGDGPFTVFAPTNVAVEGLLNLLGANYNSFDDFDTFIELEILERILTYHLVEGEILSTNIVAGEIPTLYEGNSLGITISGDSFVIEDASQVAAKPISIDGRATNGVVHIIDKILVPQDVIQFLGNPDPTNTDEKTIKELILETEDFTFLKEALTLTGLLETLGEDGPFTVFAPRNDALLGLLGLLGDEFTSLEDFAGSHEIALLRDILLYHVLGENLGSNNFFEGQLNTLSDGNTLRLAGDDDDFVLVDALQLESKFTATDIPAKNGVIHTVDRVLIPQSIVDLVESTVYLAFERAMLETGDLNTALEFFKRIQDRMNLETLAEKEFTFFFPSDQAFIDLFNQIGIDRIEGLHSQEGLELLKIILSYHCVENVALEAMDFADGQSLDTFQGETLQVKVDQGVYVLDKTGVPSKVIVSDQEILNGYIHVVDKILLPEEIITELSLLHFF